MTGTRLGAANGFNAPTPVSVIGAAQLDARAKGTIAESLFELPALRPTTGVGAQQRGTVNAGQALLDLRGLGRARTLVLVNGERVVGTSGDGSFDTNMIPSLMVQRVDVVTGGASAAYGSDAVAGVVNFVINREMEGVSGRAQYGISKYGDDEQYLVGLAGGSSFASGRGHITIGGEYARNKGAPNLSSRPWGRAQNAMVTLGVNRPAGTPANLITDNAQSSISPGGLITGCIRGGSALAGSACPLYGTTFNGTGQPGAFQFGSPVGSTTMVGGGNSGHWVDQYIPLGQGYERYALMGTIKYDLTDNVQAHLDVMGGRFQVASQSVFFTANGNIRINRDNPFLPTALATQMDAAGVTQLVMSRQNEDLGGIKPTNVSSYVQGRFGLNGTFLHDWKWTADVGYGSSKFTYQADDFLILPNYFAALYAVRDASGNIVCGPLASNPMAANLTAAQKAVIGAGCVPFNPFGANRTDQLAGAYNYIYGQSSRSERFKRTSASINVSGSPFSTWAGPVHLAAGYEYRHDDVADTVPASIAALSAAGGFFATNFLPGGGNVTINEGYGEVGIPLLSGKSAPGKLDLNGAVRFTNYSTSGGVTTWKIGAVYEPISAIRFRGTLSHDIRAPNIPELFIPAVEGLSVITRPDTLASGQVRTQAVSNPNLKPERADTYTFGVVLKPAGALSGLRVSVDYFNIKIKDVIASLSVLEVVARRFGPTQDTSLDPFIVYDNSALGIAKIGSPLLNLNSQKTNGVDFDVQYRLPDFGIGLLDLSVNGTYTHQLETFDRNGASVGGNLAGESRGVPKWRMTFNLAHDLGRFNTILTARYNGPFKYRNDLVDPGDPGYDPAKSNSVNDNHLPASVYFSLTENVRLTSHRDGPTAFFIIDNLLDKDPPFGSYLPLSAIFGYNPFDPLGRSYKVGVRFKY